MLRGTAEDMFHFCLFWVAPIVGALLAGLVYRFLFEERRPASA